MPKGKGNKIQVVPPAHMPYVRVEAEAPDSPGLDPVTVDLDLKRGVWIEGKLTDKVTGKPAEGGVRYLPLDPNPNVRDYPGFEGLFSGSLARKDDGSYRIVGLPGPGVVAVFCHTDHYLPFSDRDDEYALQEPALLESRLPAIQGSNCGALARIDPARGALKVKRDVTLDPGWTFTATLLGPDGKPLAGARSFGANGRWWDREAKDTAEFTEWCNPRRPCDTLFQHLEKGLIGVAHPPKENGGAVTVRMEPGAAVTGRLVNADGKPRAGVELEVLFGPKEEYARWPYSPERIRTDREGRFRVGALLPGYQFRLKGDRGELRFGAPRPGQTKDLGDVQMSWAEE
jgi:hypothetical protein